MEKLGWKGVIYDAQWARFKAGQKGVIVYEGGKECEATDEAKDRIEIEVDKNASLYKTRKGYILFTQKGTNCTDVVCISQEAGGTYELFLNDIELYECLTSPDINGYNVLVNKIKENTYESVNGGEKTPVRDWSTKTIYPSYEDYSPGIVNRYVSRVEDNENNASASATIIITPAQEEIKNCTVSIPNDLKPTLDNLSLKQVSSATSFPCTGGTVSYSVEKVYTIDLSRASCTITYQKCGTESRVEEKNYLSIQWEGITFDSNGNETNEKVEITGNIMKITVKKANTKKVKIIGKYSTSEDFQIVEL